jgi:hypothetical protein
VTANHLFRKSELAADVAHFVLEQLAQRFDQLELHVGLQSADIVMRFDRDRRPTARRERFDDVGIERSLHEKIRALACPARCRLEDVDERVSDDRSLPLGSSTPANASRKRFDASIVTSLMPRLR